MSKRRAVWVPVLLGLMLSSSTWILATKKRAHAEPREVRVAEETSGEPRSVKEQSVATEKEERARSRTYDDKATEEEALESDTSGTSESEKAGEIRLAQASSEPGAGQAPAQSASPEGVVPGDANTDSKKETDAKKETDSKEETDPNALMVSRFLTARDSCKTPADIACVERMCEVIVDYPDYERARRYLKVRVKKSKDGAVHLAAEGCVRFGASDLDSAGLFLKTKAECSKDYGICVDTLCTLVEWDQEYERPRRFLKKLKKKLARDQPELASFAAACL